MTKFLKRTVAVLLTVCLAASLAAPVSALTITGTETKEVLVTKNYAFNTSTLPNFGTGHLGGETHVSQGTDVFEFYTGNRSGATIKSGFLQANNFGTGSYFVFKLTGIGTAVDKNYTISVVPDSTNAAAPYIYVLSNDYTTFGDIKNYKDTGLKLGQFTTETVTKTNQDLTNCLDSEGNLYVAVAYSSSKATIKLAAIQVSYTEQKTETGTIYEGPAATATAEYDFFPVGLFDTTAKLFGDNVKGVLDNGYGTDYPWTPFALDNSNGAEAPSMGEYNGNYYIAFGAYPNDWLALKFVSPGAGEYDIKLDVQSLAASAENAAIYILKYTNDTDAMSDIEAAVAGGESLLKTETKVYNKNIIEVGTLNFEADANYIVVFQGLTPRSGKNTARFDVQKMIMTKDLMEYEDIANGEFSAFTNVKLAYDYEGSINVKGYTLDLNGKTVNGSVIATSGNVIDSIGSGKITGTVNIGGDNAGYIPLKEGTATRLFASTSTVEFDSANPYVDGDYLLYWFDINFSDSDAYGLIAGGNSGLAINASIAVDDEIVVETVKFEETVKNWAAAESTAPGQAMGVALTNIDAAQGSAITVVFTYESAGVVYEIGSLSYTVE